MAENDTIQSQDEVVATLSHVDEYLKIGQEYDCSDIHLATNAKPTNQLQEQFHFGTVLMV